MALRNGATNCPRKQSKGRQHRTPSHPETPLVGVPLAYIRTCCFPGGLCRQECHGQPPLTFLPMGPCSPLPTAPVWEEHLSNLLECSCGHQEPRSPLTGRSDRPFSPRRPPERGWVDPVRQAEGGGCPGTATRLPLALAPQWGRADGCGHSAQGTGTAWPSSSARPGNRNCLAQEFCPPRSCSSRPCV